MNFAGSGPRSRSLPLTTVFGDVEVEADVAVEVAVSDGVNVLLAVGVAVSDGVSVFVAVVVAIAAPTAAAVPAAAFAAHHHRPVCTAVAVNVNCVWSLRP